MNSNKRGNSIMVYLIALILILAVSALALAAPIQSLVDGNGNAIGVTGNPLAVNSSRSFSTTPLTNATGNSTITFTAGTTVMSHSIKVSPKTMYAELCGNCTTNLITLKWGQGNAAPAVEGSADSKWAVPKDSNGNDYVIANSGAVTNSTFFRTPFSMDSAEYGRLNIAATANGTCTDLSFNTLESN